MSESNVDREALERAVWGTQDGYSATLRQEQVDRVLRAIEPFLATQPISAPVDADAVERAVGGVLFNAMNYPARVQALMLAQDVGPLRRKVVDAVLAHLATRPSIGQCARCGEPVVLREGDPDNDSMECCPRCVAEMYTTPAPVDARTRRADMELAIDGIITAHPALQHEDSQEADDNYGDLLNSLVDAALRGK